MTIFDLPVDEHYNYRETYSSHLSPLRNDYLFKFLDLDFLSSIQQHDGVKDDLTWVFFDSQRLKSFICIKKDNRYCIFPNGLRITSIGYSSLLGFEDMVNHIVLSVRATKPNYTHLWFEETQKPFIPTDFSYYGFTNLCGNIWYIDIKKHKLPIEFGG